MPFFFSSLLLTLALTSCEIYLQDDPKINKEPGTPGDLTLSTPVLLNEDKEGEIVASIKTEKYLKNTHLFFTTIDPYAAPWQADVLSLDLESGEIKKILTGESSDPGLYYANESVWLFNRSYASQNFRSLTPKAGDFQISQQRSYAAGNSGDPHDVIALKSGHLLTANYSNSSLQIIEPTTGRVVDEVKAGWDLPAGAALRPEALVAMTSGEHNYIYVVHQSLELKYNLVLSNGSQQVFVLEEKDGSIIAVDLDATTPAVEGIKLRGSYPVPLRQHNSQALRLVSFCSLLTTKVDGYEDCHAAVEEIDSKSHSAKVLWDLDDSGYYMNGMAAAGPSSDVFYANVDQQLLDDVFEKRVLRFEISKKTTKEVYRFNQDAGGFWGVFYDQDRQKLYVGDQAETNRGTLTILSEAEIANGSSGMILDLDAVPYSGAFFRQFMTQ